MCILTDGSEKVIPPIISHWGNNTISQVWLCEDGWVYKRSIPFLIENEYGMLKMMEDTGFVPRVERYDKYTLKIERVSPQLPLMDPYAFRARCERFLSTLSEKGIRHGDLTPPHVLHENDFPVIIDWAESRFVTDPRPDKRAEGDGYWMEKTLQEISHV